MYDPTTDHRMMTYQEAGAFANVSARTVKHWADRGLVERHYTVMGRPRVRAGSLWRVAIVEPERGQSR